MISFNPTLNETTILNIPFHPGHLTFTATVTPDDELQLDSRSIIQIWADIPDNNQPLGLIKGEQQEWSARSFEFQNNSSTAYLPIPFQSFLHDPYRSHFSFTYRILHPDGRVQWLGEYGKNGSLIVNRYDDRLVLFGDWAANPLGHSFTPKSTIKSPLQVLALSDKIQWRCWDLSNGAPKLLSGNDGPTSIHSALLVPTQSKSTLVPLSPILLSSKHVQVSIRPNSRSLYITSPSRGGLLSLQTLSPDALISSITDILPTLTSIPDPDKRHALLLENHDPPPAQLFVIPLSARSSASVPSILSLPLSPFLSHVKFLSTAPSSHLAISNPTRFIPTSADHLHLHVLDFGGAQFSLSPVYDLVKPDGDVRLTVFANHNRVATPTSHNLLTPPPSPPLTANSETVTRPLHSPEQSPDQLPATHSHLDDPTSKLIEPLSASRQSTPNPPDQEQLASGQSTPVPQTNTAATPPVHRGIIRKLIYFVLRILAFYARVLSKIIFTIFVRLLLFSIPKKKPVATSKVTAVEPAIEQTTTNVSSAAHTPHKSGASTPRNDPVISADKNIFGVAETLQAAATRILPEFTATAGDDEKPLEVLGGSYVQEPYPDHDIENEKSSHGGEWEVVHRPGIALELAPLPTLSEGEVLQQIKLIVDGEQGLINALKLNIDDVEFPDFQAEPTAQEGLWTIEIPRKTRDLTTLWVS